MQYLKKYREFILLFICSVIVFLLVGNEYYVYKDSNAYIQMQADVPPIYPCFLALLRFLFGEAYYLNAVVYVQMVVGALSIALLVMYIRKQFQVNIWLGIPVYVGALVPYFVEAMREQPRRMTVQCILTEGLAIPFFYFWILFCLRVMMNKRFRDYIWVLVFSVILYLTRAQFLLCFAMDALLLLYFCYVAKDLKRKLVIGIGTTAVAYFLMQGVDTLYTYAMLGETKTAWNSSSVMTHLMYVSSPEDAERIEDEEVREVFLLIYEKFDEVGCLDDYAGDTVSERSNHWSEYFMKGYMEVERTIDQYAQPRGLTLNEEQKAELVADIIDALKFNFPKSVIVSLNQFPLTLSHSVFISKQGYETLGYVVSCVILICAIVLMLYRFKQDKNSIDALFMLFIIIYMLANGVATEYMIRSLQRYLYYTQGLFYITGLLMLIEVYRSYKNRKSKQISG